MGRMENPGALAGATGATALERNFNDLGYRKRAEAATSLCVAIAACAPADAAPILETTLMSITAGAPLAPLLGIMDVAASWANKAILAELKAYCLATYTRLPPADQAAFLLYPGAL